MSLPMASQKKPEGTSVRSGRWEVDRLGMWLMRIHERLHSKCINIHQFGVNKIIGVMYILV
jgi:hypothetical protein